jgi:hypothetical protein
MKVITETICLVVALTLIVTAGAFAQMTPQAEGNTDSQVTNTKVTNGKTSTDPTPSTDPTTSTEPTTPATDCASEIVGMNAVLKAIPTDERTSLGGAGRLPDIPCNGYRYAADFTIVPDTPSATPAVSQPQG